MSKLGSTSPSVTGDALNAAAIILCVLISLAQYNLHQTRRFPSEPCFFTFHSPSP
ncbi:hypothetical protein BTN50_1417 [Candidatus Enterovibrio altilux]|uniref:Mobile element protein n=1 Tax=Candidatus Enterovibrio altilux TaxID=1927128 RepID=A0A291BA61_9GAMM|nr:hypothetical protein BTN50_1417 [Candidatus Enterovibrio luxaltus]